MRCGRAAFPCGICIFGHLHTAFEPCERAAAAANDPLALTQKTLASRFYIIGSLDLDV
jgi:hypothetical protein